MGIRKAIALAGLAVLAIGACSDRETTGIEPATSEFALATGGGSSAATLNAQSIMVTPTFDSFYLLEGTETWQLDLDDARTYYGVNVTGPTIGCSGGGRGGVNCLAANQPATPAMPAADPNEPSASYFNAGGNKNRCTFWNGGTPDAPGSYTQSVTINGVNGSGNWTFTWTYAPVAPASVPARTAWDLISTTGDGEAEIELTGFVAGQSVVKKTKTSGKNDWNFKVSHTITNAEGHRVAALAYSVDGADAVYFDALTQLILEQGVDFYYAQNSGNNGFLDLLVDGAMVDVIQNGGAFSPSGNSDNFDGNNATLGERVNFSGPVLMLGDGDHTIVITGIVKGNSGLGDVAIAVSKTVTIDAQGCAAAKP